ncbi:MAG: glycogen synthase GlgA [Nitrospinae bacterium CG11_big_fil_rev_8_21_14_0_20_56_8]|nr:MAG: glycogen synthase GlgA [Nitrospinae bacterium CG11_big_fil_rev_8_21_14_0_20_56_8]
MSPPKLKILLASSEVYPFAKTGGLGDIAGSLPKALRQLGHEVRVITPKYKVTAKCPLGFRPMGRDIDVPVGPALKKGFLYESRLAEGVPVYLVGNDEYYHRDELYGEQGREYPDNPERFIFFCRAVLESCKATGFFPDIFHCNDWQTGLVPVYLKTLYAQDPDFARARTIFSIHNLAFQGNYPPARMTAAHLPPHLFRVDGLEFYGNLSFMKGGLMFADLLTTVSKTYSKEIQTPEFGFGMDGILRSRSKDLYGFLNGADYEEWDPETDPLIPENYNAKNLSGKQECKRELKARFKLSLPEEAPLFCMVSRLSAQKGISLIMESAEKWLADGAGFVLLGSGEPRFEEFFLNLARKHPAQCGAIIGYNEELAHQIMAGGDLLFVPSQYEPCGLTQIYGLKYGAVPLVRSVGGLQDTIQEFQSASGSGNGFKFRPYENKYLLQAVKKALSLYKQKNTWRTLMRNGMNQSFGWDHSAGQYSRLYYKLLSH